MHEACINYIFIRHNDIENVISFGHNESSGGFDDFIDLFFNKFYVALSRYLISDQEDDPGKLMRFLSCRSRGFSLTRSREVIEIPIMFIKMRKAAPNIIISATLSAI